MESIKYNSTLPDESISRPSFNKMNQKDVFQVPKNIDAVEFNSRKNPIDGLPWIVDDLAQPIPGFGQDGMVTACTDGALQIAASRDFFPGFGFDDSAT